MSTPQVPRRCGLGVGLVFLSLPGLAGCGGDTGPRGSTADSPPAAIPAPQASVPANGSESPSTGGREAGSGAGAFAEPIAIPEGMLIRAHLDEAVSARSHGAGASFEATVSEELLAQDGMVLVPEGAALRGRVDWSLAETPTDEATASELIFESLLIEGERISIHAVVIAVEERRTPGVDPAAADSMDPSDDSGGEKTAAASDPPAGGMRQSGRVRGPASGEDAIRQGTILVVRLESPVLLAPH